MHTSPFDDELADAYAALQEQATVPEANRRELLKRYLPTIGIGVVAIGIVGSIGVYAIQARSQAAQVMPVHAAQLPSQPAAATLPLQPGTPDVNVQPPAPVPQTPDQMAGGASGSSAPLGVLDLAVRYAYTWANRGGGIDPMIRAQQLAAMRGHEAPSAPVDDGTWLQVVLDAHVAEVKVRESTQLVTVALLLAGQQAPVWSALQIAVVPSSSGGWTVAGDPVWVAFPPTGKPLASTTPKLTWVPPEQSTSRGQLTTFFTKYGQEGLVHDPAIVAKPIGGLAGLMKLDQIEGVATDGRSNQLYARVRWVSPSGLGMSQVYRLTTAPNGGIDSVEVAAIE